MSLTWIVGAVPQKEEKPMAKNSNNNSKTNTTKTKVTTPVLKNDNSKKNTKEVNNQITDTFFNSNTKTTPVTAPVTKTTGSGSNQAGKKRGAYSQNLWAIEFRDGNKYLAEPNEVYLSRDDAREALDFFRGEENYKKGDARLAKYTFNRADHS